MNRLKSYLAVAAFALMVVALPAIASAQYGQYDPYGRDNGRYGQYDPYGRGSSGYYGDQRSVIRSLKQKTRDFTRMLDRDLDRSRLNGSPREDQINRVAAEFRNAVNDLDNNGYYDNRRGRYDGDREMRRVYSLAAQIERSIGRAQISYQTRNLWGSVRNDLQVLSRGYGYNTGRPGNRDWGNSRNNRNGLPSWWPF
jgi:hypothetical protein